MFLILGLPRSRTFWLSKFLTYDDFECGHEEARHLRNREDAEIWLRQEHRGSAETAIAPYWRLMRAINPQLRIVIIRRPVLDVVDSMMALDLSGICELERTTLTRRMAALDTKLQQIGSRLPGVMTINYHELDQPAAAAAIFEYCLPYRFDRAWWDAMRAINLQCDMRALTRYAIAYRGPLERMAAIAGQLSRAQLSARPLCNPAGVTLQQETWEQFERDGEALFAQHVTEVGESPDSWRRKNLPLLRGLYANGALQVTTARCNGRMFGYLVTVLSPSLESVDGTMATNTLFYASSTVPGLGLKLQRASIEALKRRGVAEVFLPANDRADGPRLGILYKRLGAAQFGATFRLQFGGQPWD